MVFSLRKQFISRFSASIILSALIAIPCALWLRSRPGQSAPLAVALLVVLLLLVVFAAVLWLLLGALVRRLIRKIEAQQTLFKILPAGVSIMAPDRSLQEINKALENILGLTEEQLRAGQYRSRAYCHDDGTLFTPDEFPSVRALAEQREVLGEEMGVVKEDGTTVWIHTSAAPLPDGRVVTVTLDITERKRIERELTLFRALVDQSHDAFYVVDSETARILDVNERAEKMLGYRRDELRNMRIQDINAEVTDEAAWKSVLVSLQHTGSRVWESRHRRKDGTTFPVELSVRRHSYGDRSFNIAVARDITGRKQIELDLRIKNNAIETSINGIAISDMNGILTYANRAYVRMLGYDDAAEVLGRPIADLSESAGMAEDILSALKTKGAWIGEVSGRRKDGSAVPRLMSASIVTEPDGTPVSMLGSFLDISELVHAERSLRESEERLRRAQQVAHIGSWELDLIAGRLSWSDEIFRIFEIDKERFSASYEAFLACIHPEDRDAVNRAYQDSVREHSAYAIGHRLRMADGRIKYVQENGETLYDAGGRPVRSFGTVQDLTGLRLAEEQLRKSEERLRQAMDATNDGLWDWDLATGAVYYSPGYFRMLGYEPDELQGGAEVWADRIHPDDRERTIRANQDCIENRTGGVDVEFRMRSKSGAWIWILGRGKAVSRDSSGRALRMLGTHVDITERKLSEERYRNILQTAIDGYWLTDAGGRLLEVNDAYCRMSGYSRDELLRMNIRDLEAVEDPEETRSHIEKIALRGFDRFTSKQRRKDGTLMDMEINVQYSKELGGVLIVFLQDITERRLAEEAIRTSLREKETLLREIHHRVKNNLQVISSLLYFQAKKMKDEEGLAALKEGQDRLRSMILVHEKLYRSRDLANIDFGDYVRSLTDQMLQSYAAIRERVTVGVDVERVFLPIEIALPCGMILNELVTNIFKYAFPEERTGQATIRSQLRAGSLVLIVRDTGAGIPPEINTQEPVTFGLQLISNLVQQLGGTVVFDREGGTAVTIEVPVNAGGRGGA